jgi:hypothetical protein
LVSEVDINQQESTHMSTSTETKRGRGRPATFPTQNTKMAGYNLPVTTLEIVRKAAAKREVNQNLLVNRALLAYLRKG